jgi:aryl-alcohol dehydrogenase-like predicted oxidoreductase
MSVPIYFQTRHSGSTPAEIDASWKTHLQNLQADLMASMDQGRPASDWSRNVVLYHVLKALYPKLEEGLVLGTPVSVGSQSLEANCHDEKIKELEHNQSILQQQLQICQAELQHIRDEFVFVQKEHAKFKLQIEESLKEKSESPALSPTPASSPVHPPQVSPVLSVSTDNILKF